MISAIPGISCKQQANYAETISGCDLENKYYFYEKRIDKNKTATNIPIFKAKEKSNFCSRQCLGNDTRSLEVKVYNETSPQQIPCLLLRKECNFHCFCIDWP